MHNPVLLNEVIEHLNPKDGGIYIDATFGAGGYTQKILDAANCKVIGIDQDPLALTHADKIKGDFELREGNFGDLDDLVSEKIDGIVFDIGVSSMQLDDGSRGFSFMKDGPLDMRMSQHGKSAADFLNQSDEKEIADVIYKYGEERKSRRIAKSIVNSRPLTTTFELKAAVHKAIGNSGKTDSATKTFQAVRIFINRELENLEKGLKSALALLKNGGRLVVVTFHSLEDRIVKLFFKEESGGNNAVNRHIASADINEASQKTLELLNRKAVKPSDEEVQSNPRARSAKLRAATKLGNNNEFEIETQKDIINTGGSHE